MMPTDASKSKKRVMEMVLSLAALLLLSHDLL